MTSLLSPSTRVARSAGEVSADLRHRRPLVLTTLLGGAVAAFAPLLIAMAAGVAGWFLTDAGAHGTSSDGLRMGALGWLLGHGSGLTVAGASVTVVPLGITALCAWACWRAGLRVGDSVSAHGPDVHRLGDGERDMIVPTAALCFAIGYVAVAELTVRLAGSAATRPSSAGVFVWSVLLAGGIGGCAIAVGSGRAAGWLARVPEPVRATGVGVRLALVCWWLVSSVVFVVSLIWHFSTAANIMSQLHTHAGGAVLYVLLMLLVLPNAALFSGSYLLGPGFTVGVGTLVSPGAVAIGPLPILPLLAALPGSGHTPAWLSVLQGLAPLVAVSAVALTQHRRPAVRWEVGLARGLAVGVVAGVATGLLSAVAGGAIGPGRMADFGPLAGAGLWHAIAYFGVGGLAAGAVMTWWQRRQYADA